MSEFQYYEFYAVDKPLSKEDIATVNTFSSRSHATSRKAAFEYSYGNFPKNEKEVLKKYFDMMVYVSNFGYYRWMIKFPIQAVSFDQLKAFHLNVSEGYTNEITISKDDNHVLLTIEYSEEEPPGWIEAAHLMNRLLPIRDQIMAGDYRSLYLIWVHMVFENKADHIEDWPCVINNLTDLDDSHDCLVDLLRIDQDMISALQSYSSVKMEPTTQELKRQIEKLTLQEKDTFLMEMLDNTSASALKLKKRLLELSDSNESEKPEVFLDLETLEIEVEKQKELRLNHEKRMKEQAWIQKMQKIGKDQDFLWQCIEKSASLKLARGYEEAASDLKDLKDFHVFKGKESSFDEKFKSVLDRHGKSVAFRRRLVEIGVIASI